MIDSRKVMVGTRLRVTNDWSQYDDNNVPPRAMDKFLGSVVTVSAIINKESDIRIEEDIDEHSWFITDFAEIVDDIEQEIQASDIEEWLSQFK